MAQDRSDDDVLEEGASSSAKILGLPKKTAIIAASALLVVIIAASTYFFLAAGNDEQVETASQNPDNLEAMASPEAEQAAASTQAGDQINTLQTEVFDLREQVIQLKEENLVLKKKIYDFETKVPASTQQQSNQASSSNSQFKPGEPIEFKDFPPIEPAVPVEKPKPKWG